MGDTYYSFDVRKMCRVENTMYDDRVIIDTKDLSRV